MINGTSTQRWHVYKGIERDYVRQVMSEQLTPKGWVVRKGYSDNHLWDCEVLQVLAATISGFIKVELPPEEESKLPNKTEE